MFKKIFLLLTILIFTLSLFPKNDARVLRFADINNDFVVFVYSGDIWRVSINGGNAKRLSSHKGLELFPKISPDGKWIAFSGEYSGSRQVYVMPSEGGTPVQLTYYNDVGIMPPRGGFDNITLDWTPDSKHILFRANRTPYGKRMGKYFLISRKGGFEKALQIPEAGMGSFSPDGKSIVYTPISREFRTWKRYRGGRAADIWTYDLVKNRAKRITKFIGTDQTPIWYKNKLYFASDRPGEKGDFAKLNIWEFDLVSKKFKQITFFKEYDCLWLSSGGDYLVFENGGFLYKIKLNSKNLKPEKLIVNINYDNPNLIPYFKNVKKYIYYYDISPHGKRALFEARGDIFTLPAEKGVTYNLTQTQGVRELYPTWSPDGKSIAYFSDKTGEYEIYLYDIEKDKHIQLTKGSKIWRHPMTWSPDSKKLLFSDKTLFLQYFDIDKKKFVKIDKSDLSPINYYNWSSDSNWIVYTKPNSNYNDSIWLYSLKTGKKHRITDNRFNDFFPVFSTDGKFIFFASNRTFNLSFSSFEFNYLYNKATGIYAIPLQKDYKLFEYKGIEIKDSGNKKSNSKSKTDEKSIKIDFNGIENRELQIPIGSGNIYLVDSIEGGILYTKNGKLYKYSFKDKTNKKIGEGIYGIILSFDKKSLIYRARGGYGISKLTDNIKPKSLNFNDMVMKINPRKEWNQIFNDAWRIFRDWFYDKNLHHVDWNNVRERYFKMAKEVPHRFDLDYVLGEIVGEINAGHCYINWGDFERVKRIDTGLMGVELEPDYKAGYYKIKKIYKGESWSKSLKSPLLEPGINVKEGDYLICLNNHRVRVGTNPYVFLENRVGKITCIGVNSIPEKKGMRKYWFKPIKSELKLFYHNWVEERRRLVDKLSKGRIGYIHVPDTSIEGNEELFKGMYSYFNKEALIIDDRYNGGGFIPVIMTELLARKTQNYWARRGLKLFAEPLIAHNGPKVMLINHYSSSGGDAFPYYFRKNKLGILIGTRTWGGLIGISGNPRFVDGGGMYVPTFGFVDTEGNWNVEGRGVKPDVEIYDRPDEVARGKDPSIEYAVKYLLKQLRKNPIKKIKKPASPDRSVWIEKKKNN